jgi:prephenate dehydratase
VRRVVSHPVALDQCRRFLTARPWLRTEPHHDTSGALAMLIESSASGAAAIASERAADIWGGVVLKRDIQDHADNVTTFVLISRDPRANRTGLLAV